jgi:hypothetical protein
MIWSFPWLPGIQESDEQKEPRELGPYRLFAVISLLLPIVNLISIAPKLDRHRSRLKSSIRFRPRQGTLSQDAKTLEFGDDLIVLVYWYEN